MKNGTRGTVATDLMASKPWTIKGIPRGDRKDFTAAAARRGMAIGAWFCRAGRNQIRADDARQDRSDPGSASNTLLRFGENGEARIQLLERRVLELKLEIRWIADLLKAASIGKSILRSDND